MFHREVKSELKFKVGEMEMNVKGILERRNSKIEGIETGDQNDYLERESKWKRNEISIYWVPTMFQKL